MLGVPRAFGREVWFVHTADPESLDEHWTESYMAQVVTLLSRIYVTRKSVDIHFFFQLLKYLNLKKLCSECLIREVQPKNFSSGNAVEDLKSQIDGFIPGWE